jgi:hypothetical protein
MLMTADGGDLDGSGVVELGDGEHLGRRAGEGWSCPSFTCWSVTVCRGSGSVDTSPPLHSGVSGARWSKRWWSSSTS